jgi:hypothetical protein
MDELELKAKINKDDNYVVIWTIFYMFVGITLISFMLFINESENREFQLKMARINASISYEKVVDLIDTVNTNCDSSFITKRFNDEKYYVFVNSDKYILLSECLQ